MSENEKKEEAEFEIACQNCDGFGGWRENGVWGKCPKCGVKGFFPTEFGERVLDLMRRNMGSFLAR